METGRVVDLRAYLASRNARRSADSLTIILADDLPFPWHTIERSTDGGASYNVYGWRTQPDAPRVVGQHPTREIVATFPTLHAAVKAYPQASVVAEVADLVACRGKQRGQ